MSRPTAAMLHVKHLRPFMVVAQHGSLARASEELHRAQSAVSRSVHELEAHFDVTLFERAARRWLLTEFGRALHHRARFAFAELQEACETLCARYPAAAFRLRAAPFFQLAVHERRLDLLMAFTRRQHISAAALQMGISQPAASIALHDLEASVGVPLFDRAHSGVALTDAGDVLVAHTKRALAQLRLAASELSASKGVIEGRIVIGALPFGRSYVLPVAIARLLEAWPRVQVSTVEAPLDALTQAVRLGDVDFLFGALQPDMREHDLVREELWAQPLALMVRAGHPLAGRARLSLGELLGSGWVMSREGSPTRDALAACFAQARVEHPRVAVESSDLSIIRGLLLETDMVTAASPQLFQQELSSGMLVALNVALPGTERAIGLVRRTVEHSSPAARLLIEEIRKVRMDGDPHAAIVPPPSDSTPHVRRHEPRRVARGA